MAAQATNRPPVRSSVLDVERTAFLWGSGDPSRLPAPRFTGCARRAPQAGRVMARRCSLSFDGVLASGMIIAAV